MLKNPKRDHLAAEWIGLIGTVTGTAWNCPSLPWTDTALATHLRPCLELLLQVVSLALSLGQPAFELHPESLLLVDLHFES